MPHNRLPRMIQKLQTRRQKEPGETTEETSRCVRTRIGQQVAQLHDS